METQEHNSYEEIHDELLRYTQGRLKVWPSLKARVSPEDLIHEVWTRLLESEKLPDNNDERLRLMKTAILNQARSHHRRFERMRRLGDAPENNPRLSSPREQSTLEKSEHLKNLLPHFRKLQSLSKDPWDSKTRISYYAIFLMDLRLALSALLGRSLSPDDLHALLDPSPDFQDFAALIEALLKWEEEQGKLGFKENWPSLFQSWDGLRGDVNRHPHNVAAPVFCESIQKHLDDEFLRISTWHKWLERARDRAFQEYGAAQWKTYFQPFLGAPRGKEGVEEA